MDACVLHLAEQIDNVAPPSGYFKDPNIQVNKAQTIGEPPTISGPSYLLSPTSDSQNNVLSLGSNPVSFTLETAKAPGTKSSAGSISPEGIASPTIANHTRAGPVDSRLVSFHTENADARVIPVSEQGIALGTTGRTSTLSPPAAPNTSLAKSSDMTTSITSISVQRNPVVHGTNSAVSQAQNSRSEGSMQSAIDGAYSSEDNPDSARKNNPGLLRSINAAPPGTESSVSGLKEPRRVLTSTSRNGISENDKSEGDEESDGGEYILRASRVRRRNSDSSEEEERRKRRKKRKSKNHSVEARQGGDTGPMRTTVPQYQIDAMIEWRSSHPLKLGVNKKVYWSRFVEEVCPFHANHLVLALFCSSLSFSQTDVGKERTWLSWDAVSRYHGGPLIGKPTQQTLGAVRDVETARQAAAETLTTLPPRTKSTQDSKTVNETANREQHQGDIRQPSTTTSQRRDEPLPSPVVPRNIPVSCHICLRGALC